jgi:two-component system sensor histidine kinase ArlS
MEEVISSNSKFHFFSTIRFKLTVFYSLVFIIFSVFLIIILNVYLNDYFSKDPKQIPDAVITRTPKQIRIEFQQLNAEEQERIRQVRLQDLERIRFVSLLSVLPISFLSFVVGYYISGKFLDPIDSLRAEIDKTKATRLGKKIKRKANDEIGRLVDSFNEMSERLAEAFDSQTRFIQDASHELKTPLAIIQTNLDSIMEDDHISKEELQSAVRESLFGIKRLSNLTKDLLELSKEDKDNFKEFNLNEVLDAQIKELSQHAKDQKVIIKKDFEEKLIIMKGNSLKLGRAVYNLIENAIKYSSQSKDSKNFVIVRAKHSKDSQIIIEIEDNGVGIPKNKLNEIFERFYRLDNSRSRDSGGFGLGLSIVKKIVEDHGGTVEVKSQIGLTIFRIILEDK